MNKAQRLGMKHLTRTDLKAVLYIGLIAGCALTSKQFGTAIALIGKKWMTYMLHMGTNLVGTSCFKYAFY